MPTFFSFEQGSESRSRLPATEASPLLGRFRAVPNTHPTNPQQRPLPRARHGSLGLLSRASWRNSVHIGHGYGALAAADADSSSSSSGESDSDEDNPLLVDETQPRWLRILKRIWRKRVHDLWIAPTQTAVRRLARSWWRRWLALVVLPALLAVGWCAVPFPQYPLSDDDDDKQPGAGGGGNGNKAPGHGSAKVEVNFWFFLAVYYAFYNLTALIWITKVFNLYSLNWWPRTLGFPLTIALIAALAQTGPLALRHLAPANVFRFLTTHNTVWISWTFCIMAMPVMIASCILLTKERHLGLRHAYSLSETQRIFTSSWWAGEGGGGGDDGGAFLFGDSPAGRHAWTPGADDDDARLMMQQRMPARSRLRGRFFPASFVRFVWFCTALFIGLLAYVIGEAYAEVYLRTLPHSSLDTVVYVYGWIATVYLLDGLTGWILGGNQGERVGSYPLSWVFKLYFMLTYQTYVRALYARLRSPKQFILLQILSSSGLIILTPLLLSAPFHWLLTVLGMNTQSYAAYQKLGVRNVFIRFVAENASMVCFLGSVVVLHFGANRDVYPYFAFDEKDAGDGTRDDPYDYTFELTFYASAVTWACELVASCVVAGVIRWIYGVSVVEEGALDLAVWPELLPTSVVVVLHVLQNMLFSIVRLQFR